MTRTLIPGDVASAVHIAGGGGGGAVALVQANISRSGALAFGASLAAGNLLVATVSTYQSLNLDAVPTDTRGHTWLAAAPQVADSVINFRMRSFYVANCTAGACSVTFPAYGGGDHTRSIAEFSGIATASPVDVDTSSNGTSTTASAGTITPTVAALVYASMYHEGANPAITEDTADGFALVREEQDGNSGAVLAVQWKSQPASAVTPNWTIGSSNPWRAQAIAFKAA